MPRPVSRQEQLLALSGLALALFLIAIDQTVVATAMPRIVADLDGFELYSWVTTAYLLVETAGQPTFGKLGDIYGRKWITISGVAIFIVASVLCGRAASMPELVLWRGLQGLGGGMLFSTVFTTVADVFQNNIKEQAKYQGLMFSVFAIASVFGPSLGGWITDTLSWRWVFYINPPLGIITLVVLAKVLPTGQRQKNARIDYAGIVISVVMVVALLLPLELVSTGHSWTSPEVLLGLGIAVLAFALFVPVELRAKAPVIEFSLFRNNAFTVNAVVAFMTGAVMFGVTLYVPLIFQGLMGQTASSSGALMTPMSITQATIGFIGGNLVSRFERTKPFLLLGTGTIAVGTFLLLLVGIHTNPILISAYLVLIAFGLGLVGPSSMISIQASVEYRVLGAATAANTFLRTIGSTVGTALIGTIVTTSYVSVLTTNAPSAVPAQAIESLHSPNALINQEALQHLTQTLTGIPDGPQLLDALLALAREGLMAAIHNAFYLTLAAGVIALGASLFMMNVKLGMKPIPLESESENAG